ncbi:MAG TPA: XdhC family protein [Streptosporangiaceae bacterium]|nr:XdhC family protein [Streptosporangiaceae bacterium]
MYGWQVMERAAELERRGEAFALATVVWRQGPSSGQLGSRAIITSSGELIGWIGGACAEPSVIRQAREVITAGEPRLLLLGTPDQLPSSARSGVQDGMTVVPISCQSEGALEVYVEPVLPVPSLIVVGRSPMAHALANLAVTLGWRARIIDWQDFSAGDADERSMVVVATQGHGDEEAIERAVAASPAYLGLVASRKRGESVLGYLAERGVPKDQLDRVRAPAGLDLGKTSHVEIAVAILAELVRLRAAGELGGSVPGPAIAAAAVAGAATAADVIDPVCGMTVSIRHGHAATTPVTHDGVTYYFCGAGCRHEFESSPASYARKETRC